MKVLQVNCVYKKGSTGKIVYDISRGLEKRRIKSIVCYGRGEKNTYEEKFDIYKICPELYSKFNHALSRVTGIMYAGCRFSTQKLINTILIEKPDVVHLQCINGYFVNIYTLLRFLKENKICTVITLHAEFMFTGGCGYALECEKWRDNPGCEKCQRFKEETESLFLNRTGEMWKKMERAFRGFDYHKLAIVSVSPWLKERSEVSPILKNYKHHMILNGLDTSIFKSYPHEENRRKIIFHASPEFSSDPLHMKGGYYVLKLAEQMKNVDFVVAGPYSVSGHVPKNVKLLGRIADQTELAKYYSQADVTILTSKRETFSMVCAESLSCGTPVVGFKAGAPERIAIPEYSRFVDYGNLNELQKVTEEMLSIKKTDAIVKSSFERYDKENMVDNYVRVYESLLS